ncbi:MAG: hypothetical protein IPM45_13970 [Acidimicrobiales bacterium]|nr:hypothetical protein [Acidimicrobiales bacterium]
MAKRPIPRIERQPDERPTATRATEAAKAKARADAEADTARADADGRPDAPGAAAAAKGPDRAADLLRGKGPAAPDDTDDTPSGTPTGPAAAASTLPTLDSPARALRDQATLATDATRRPAFDQGLDDGPDRAEVAAAADASGLGRNPVSTLTGGSVVTGALADAAAHGDGTTGIAEQGTGAVSTGPVGKQIVSKLFPTETKPDGTQVSDKPDGGRIIIKPDGTTIDTSPDGSAVIVDPGQGTIDRIAADGQLTTTEIKGPDDVGATALRRDLEALVDGGDEAKAPPAPAGGAAPVGIPDPEGSDPARTQQFLADNPAVAAQLAQARSGGAGDVDPVEGDDTAFGVGAGAIVPDQQTGLLTNPGVAGGLAEGGVPRGPDFGGDLGAVDPGPDATFGGGGGIQEDPGDVFAASPSLDVDLSLDSSTDDTADDPAADDATTDDGAD